MPKPQESYGDDTKLWPKMRIDGREKDSLCEGFVSLSMLVLVVFLEGGDMLKLVVITCDYVKN